MIEFRPSADAAAWDAMVSRHPRAAVFHRRAYLETIASVTGADLHCFTLHRDGSAVGLCPLFTFKRGIFRIAASPPPQAAAPYLGPAVDEEHLPEALAGFVRAARGLKAHYAELRLDRLVDASTLTAVGLQPEERSTYVLDLAAGPDALWKGNFNSTCRRAVRKAESSGVAVTQERLADILDRYYELEVGVFAKWHRPPPLDRSAYARLAALQDAGDCVKVFVARLEGVLIAAGIFPYGNGAIYYLDGVSDPAGQNARPNNLLHWHVIQWAHAAGLQRYDMVGAGIAGVARFKQGFGPAEVPYTYAFAPLTPVAKLARQAYARLAPVARSVVYRLQQLRSGSGGKDADE